MASFLARRIEERGHAIDVALVEAAALLHDVDKALPANAPVKGLGHGDAGAAWLRERDHGELAGAVGSHPVMRLTENERYEFWVHEATVEERVVAYADKRARQDVVSLDERFRYWADRHPDNDAMQVARERAEKLQEEVCAAAGVAPEEVGRERWAGSRAGKGGLSVPALAYFWGEDAFGIEHAARSYASERRRRPVSRSTYGAPVPMTAIQTKPRFSEAAPVGAGPGSSSNWISDRPPGRCSAAARLQSSVNQAPSSESRRRAINS